MLVARCQEYKPCSTNKTGRPVARGQKWHELGYGIKVLELKCGHPLRNNTLEQLMGREDGEIFQVSLGPCINNRHTCIDVMMYAIYMHTHTHMQ